MSRYFAAPLLAAVVFAGLCGFCWPFTIDDAFIPCRYAANWAGGAGLTWNPGERVQGVTGIAWTLLLAGLARLGVQDLPGAAKVLGVGAGLASVVWTTTRAARQRAVGLGVLACLVPSLSVVVYAVAGLETMAFTLLVTVASWEAARRPARAGVLAALSAAVRPEGALVFAVLAATVPARHRARFGGAGLPALAAVAAVQWLAFGTLVPNTLAARTAPSGAGIAYVLGALVPTGALLLWPLAVVGGTRHRSWRPMLAVLVALTGAAVALGGDWMPGWRFLVPVWPLTALLAARGAWLARVRLGRRRLAVAPIVVLAVAALAGLASTAASLPEVRTAGLERARAAPRLVRALARHRVRSVALVDVGYVGWAGRFVTVDLGGLTDRHVARSPGVYLDKEVDETYLLGRDPDAIVVHDTGALGKGMFPVERRVVRMPGVAARYRLGGQVRRSDDYRYLVLLRR